MSLTTRISLITALLLTVCVGAGGMLLYSKVRNSMHEELEAQCLGRISVIQSRIDVDEQRLEFDDRQNVIHPTDHFRVITRDGTELWSSNWTEDADLLVRFRDAVVGGAAGAANAAPASGAELSGSDLKKAVVKGDAATSRTAFEVKDESNRIPIRIFAAVPMTHMHTELRRLSLALLTVGPLTVVIGALLMGFFIRWQLRPLTVIAREAAAIGPENTAGRIGAVGSSKEYAQLRTSINRMVERLAAGLDRERNFAAIAAHELRSPLAQLKTSIEVTLRKDRDAPEYRQTLNECLSDIQRLEVLTANLLLITRGFDAERCKTASASVHAVVGRAVRECNSNAVLPKTLPPELLVRGREELLVAALRNVLENATRYAPGQPAELSIQTHDRQIQIVIQDNGPGIPPPERDRIFDPLVRLDEARTIRDDSHGFGLGLTVARSAVRACGGDLTCNPRSDAKPGAAFVFSLSPAPAL